VPLYEEFCELPVVSITSAHWEPLPWLIRQGTERISTLSRKRCRELFEQHFVASRAASVFMLLQACLGLSIRDSSAQVSFSYPVLPPFLREVQIKPLGVGQGSVDMLLRRHADHVSISIVRRVGDVEIFHVK